MTNTYTWDFPQIDTAPTEGDLIDVAKIIHWRFVAVSDSETNEEGQALSVSAYGTASAGEVYADTFVAFDSLTKDWCKEKVLAGLEKTEAELQEMLDAQIEAIANPPVVGKLPASW